MVVGTKCGKSLYSLSDTHWIHAMGPHHDPLSVPQREPKKRFAGIRIGSRAATDVWLLCNYISRLGACGGLLSQPARLSNYLTPIATTRATSQCGITCGNVYTLGLYNIGLKNYAAFELHGMTIDAATNQRKVVTLSLTSPRALDGGD